MKICVIGSGGREHALAHALARSADVVVTPGNPGIARSAERDAGLSMRSVDAAPETLDADLYVIGPEAPLVDGLADRLRAAGKRVFGPGANGARLEGSKVWMKEVLAAAGVPTAAHETFTDLEQVKKWLDTAGGPFVVKTDGLAAGKGVLVTESRDEALADAEAKLSGRLFGPAGRRIVLEEALHGEELSVLVLCDGRRMRPLAPARDLKRLFDGNSGPNTGGMGAYSPVPEAPTDVVDQVMEVAVEPLVAELRRRGIDYRGVLYAGLMLTSEGPKVLEYNVRFGDPETQVVLPRLRGDLAGMLAEVADGSLSAEVRFVEDSCVTVVMVAEGYPSAPRRGDTIAGVEEAESLEGVAVYHAGTALDASGRLVTAGGRVLDVTAIGPTIEVARQRALDAARRIHWDGVHYRTDVALSSATASAGSVEAVAHHDDGHTMTIGLP